ncbi:MAG: 3-oxoadipate enol-lactonase [Pararhodobacter sp.]|nr:3-oxoadipate enol-lactonase [Pararhodobacter sp.]
MQVADLGDICLHYRIDGDPKGAPVVFANSLGTDLRLWDKVVPLLRPGLKIIRYDMRGHGLSDAPAAPYTMGALVRDLERLLDHLEVREAVLVGLSIGGMVAQGLAVKRLDQIRAVVLSNTAAKIGTAEMWQERVDMVMQHGVEGLAGAVMERWFPAEFRATSEGRAWRHMLERTPVAGYAGCSAAIAGTDFYSTTATLRLPAMAIAGSEDGSTPPDLVREMANLIPGSRFELIRGSGHLPCVDQPEVYAALLNDFLASLGHGAGA